MDKKDIYEHLAKIYLDSSKKHKRKKKKQNNLNAYIYLAISILILSSAILVSINWNLSTKNPNFTHQTALVIQPEVVKINYDFTSAKKEAYSIQLKDLNLKSYKALAFTLKKLKAKDNISLRIELLNNFQEKSEVYLKGIPHKWTDFKIALSDFKNITNWSKIKELSFIAEEWNTKEKNDVIFIDNVRFLK